jgi:hypothetical protein
MYLKIIKLSVFLIFIFFANNSYALNKKDINKGKIIAVQSGCIKCHSFIKGKKIDGVISLADWGNKHLSIKQTEKAIRNCKADIYCSQILTNKQVKYVAYYLNNLK